MHRLWSNSSGKRPGAGDLVAVCVALASIGLAAGQAQQPPRAASATAAQAAPAQPAAESWLAQAAKAESEMRLDVAMDRLYAILTERPGTSDARSARLRLARLLAVSGSLPQAILQCQMLRDETAGDEPLRRQALEVATLLARRLRAGQSAGAAYFAVVEPLSARGVQALDEPRALVFEADGRFLLLDQGGGRVYRIAAEAAALVASPQDPTAVAALSEGGVGVFGKTGLSIGPGTGAPPRTVTMSGTWGGKARQVRKVRSMAALSDGGLLVIDRDYDGILRCDPASGACAPWGPVGKYRVVRVGPTGWVYLLDDKGQSVRVLDPAQRLLTVVGPMAGATKLENVEDLAVDLAHGFYLLDTDVKRVHVLYLKTMPDGRFGAVLAGSLLVPQDGERAMKNPSAIGVSPDGAVLIAGKSSARLMRFR